jgi:hypothetical protein
MRAVELSLLALIAASPSAKAAIELDGALWVGASGLHVVSQQSGAGYIFKSDVASLWRRLVGSAPEIGTPMLRMHMTSDTGFAGIAYTFSTPNPRDCIFPYEVRGQVQTDSVSWSGYEPVDRAPGTCQVTRTTFTTHTLRLVAKPPSPAVQPSAPKPEVVVTNDLSPRIPKTLSEPRIDWPPSTATIVVGSIIAITSLMALAFLAPLVWFKAQSVLTDARIASAEKRAKLLAVLPHTQRLGPELSVSEIQQVLDVMPDISEAAKADLLALLNARAGEK